MAKFLKVRDAAGNPVRGLWQRGAVYYAQLAVDGSVKRIKLAAQTLGTAIDEMREIQAKRTAPQVKVVPDFEDFAQEYLANYTVGKAETTLKVERSVISTLVEFFDSQRLDEITPADIGRFRLTRMKSGVTGRTVNLNMSVLSNIFKIARTLGYMDRVPMEDVRPVKYQAKRKALLTSDDIELVCDAALELGFGWQLPDYIHFLAYTGARASEALSLLWSHVDFQRKQVSFYTTKNKTVRDVDLGVKALELLERMILRRDLQANSNLVFGGANYHDLVRKLAKAAKKAECSQFKGVHILRHYFISQCVMAGIDYMTIAKWVGHKDGGILIGKVYGHLDNKHTAEQATKLKL